MFCCRDLVWNLQRPCFTDYLVTQGESFWQCGRLQDKASLRLECKAGGKGVCRECVCAPFSSICLSSLCVLRLRYSLMLSFIFFPLCLSEVISNSLGWKGSFLPHFFSFLTFEISLPWVTLRRSKIIDFQHLASPARVTHVTGAMSNNGLHLRFRIKDRL